MMTVVGMGAGVALYMSAPQQVYAYPCTVDTINNARIQKSTAQAELLIAQSNQAAADAAVAAAKANGVTGLELTILTDQATNSANLVHAAIDKVNNTQKYIENATNRLYWEDEFIANMDKWKNQVTVDQARAEADFAQKEAANATMLVERTNQSIASQTLLATDNAAIQAQIDTMNASLPGLIADAAAKTAAANEKAEIVKTLEQTLDRKWDSGEDWYYDHMVLK